MDIAIIGMSGRFPEAASIAAFRENLRAGKDSVRPYSRKRLASTTVPYSRHYEIFAYLEEVDTFDHGFFGISLGEAENMDPHQRLLLEVVYETFEDAGYNPDYFNGTETALYVSNPILEYARHADKPDATLSVGNLSAVTAGRVSRFFNLRGAAVMVDTACSSSLVALHLACKELQHGDADFALACGVNIKLFPGYSVAQTDIGIAAPDGKTKSFSAAANGTGSGEAIGCVLLKPLDKAIADNDNIHAVIKGTAMNQEAGLSGSLTAPSSLAQSEVMIKAWQQAGIQPDTISYIEAHGTGTRLGDPIEVQGMDLAFAAYTDKKKFCAISSVKTNIGHTNSAAGICGLIKGVLSVKYAELYPSLHFDAPNPFIDFEHAAVYVNNTLQPWQPAAGIRRAGVSAFGIAGTNCHVVMEEAPARNAVPVANSEGAWLFTLSAKTQKALRNNIHALADYLLSHPQLSLQDISYTLNTGRKHYEYRFAVTADSMSALLPALLEPAHNMHAPAPATKFIFICSPAATITEELITTYLNLYPDFASHYHRCVDIAGEAWQNPVFRQFAFGYSFYKLLEAGNISCKTWIGYGPGDIVVAVISDKITLEEGVAQAITWEEKTSTHLQERCERLLARFADDQCVFVEMGPAGELSATLQSLAGHRHTIITLQDGVASFLKDLYIAGMPVAWEKTGHFFQGNRIELPVYQFERKRCWLKPPQHNFNNWYYRAGWEKVSPLATDTGHHTGVYLVWTGNGPAGQELINYLQEKGNTCIRLSPAPAFTRFNADHFGIRAEVAEDAALLAAALEGVMITGLVQFCEEEQAVDLAIHVVKAWHTRLQASRFTWLAVTRMARHIIPGEVITDVSQAAIHGCLLALKEEYPLLNARAIDTDISDPAMIAAELQHTAPAAGVGYRAKERYLPVILPVPVTEKNTSAEIVPGGLYLITGGAGGIGQALCRYIADKGGRVAVADIQPLPSADQWSAILQQPAHPAFALVKTFTRLREMAPALQYHSLDVGDEAALQALLQQLGPVNAVFHLAGIWEHKWLHTHTIADFREILQPFINGAVTLQRTVNAPVILFTGLHSIIGEAGCAAYSAAMVWLDEWQQQHAGHINIKWPGWKETGSRAGEESTHGEWMPVPMITTSEGIALLDLILQRGLQQVLISPDNPAEQGSNPYFIVPDAAPAPALVPEVITAAASAVTVRDGWTITETLLGNIWEEVLKPASLSLDDDFFDLGGHSLNGSQVIGKMAVVLGVKIDFDILLEYGTLRAVAAYIDEQPKTAVVAEDHLTIPAVPVQAHYELSHAQQRLWVINQLDPGMVAYNMSAAYLLEGDFNPAAFLRAFDALIARHEILRTTFIHVDGSPRQQVHPVTAPAFQLLFDSMPVSEADVKPLVIDDAKKPFNLVSGPLLRARLLRLDNGGYAFFFTLHHIIGDGWSIKVLTGDLLHYYNAFCLQTTPSLPALKIQYKDFAAWQHSQLTTPVLAEAAQYWQQQLSGYLPVLTFPQSLTRPAIRTFNAGRRGLLLSATESTALRALCAQQDVTIFMALLSFINAWVYACTGQEDLLIGTPVSGRAHPLLENQIGLYLNTLPLRTRFNRTDTFLQLLKLSKTTALDSFRHQLYPMDKIAAALPPSEDKSRNPLFDIGFTCNIFSNIGVITETDTRNAFDDVNVKSMDAGYPTVKADLWWHAHENGNLIGLNFDYNTQLFTHEYAEELTTGFHLLLGHFLHNPDVTQEAAAAFLKAHLAREKKTKQQQTKSRNADALNKLK
jgi:acyl transferase domain-containing protein